MPDERALVKLAVRQHGLVTRQQLLRLGWSEDAVKRRVRSGRWVRVAPSVFDVAPAAVTALRPVQAAVLSTGGWASHRTAAWLHGLLDAPPEPPELLMPSGNDRQAVHALVHRSTAMDGRDLTTVKGIACTAINRTLLDLAGVVGADELDDAISRALTSGRTSVRRLDAMLAAPMHGRRGAATLRRSLDEFRDRRAALDHRLEIVVNRAVAESGLPVPVRQLRVRTAGRVFFLDFAWPDAMVFLEADGFAFHSSRRQFTRDRERQNLLAVAGWVPLRCTWAMATSDTDELVGQLFSMLGLPRRKRAC